MLKLSKAAARHGVMVALFPSPATAAMLAQPGGEPAEILHVTLAYLGDADELSPAAADRLRQTVASFAARTAPIRGVVSGTGLFTAGPEPVTYASVDVPGLAELRTRLVEELSWEDGVDPSTEHGFTPHMTLAYDARAIQVPNAMLEFGAVSVVIGGERVDFPLYGVTPELVQKDAMYPLAVGDPVRWSHDDLTLGRSGEIVKQDVADNGAWVYDVRWEDGAITKGERQYRLRNLRDLSKADWQVPIWKADGTGEGADPLIVYGVVLQPGVPDSQGDVISAEEIEKAAHRFLIESRMHDLQHDEMAVDGIAPVENYVAPADLEVAGRKVLKGSWVMAVAVYPEHVKKAVRDGTYTGFSIGGSGFRS